MGFEKLIADCLLHTLASYVSVRPHGPSLSAPEVFSNNVHNWCNIIYYPWVLCGCYVCAVQFEMNLSIHFVRHFVRRSGVPPRHESTVQALGHPLIGPLTHHMPQSPIDVCVHPLTCTYVRSLTDLCTHSLTYLLTHSLTTTCHTTYNTTHHTAYITIFAWPLVWAC